MLNSMLEFDGCDSSPSSVRSTWVNDLVLPIQRRCAGHRTHPLRSSLHIDLDIWCSFVDYGLIVQHTCSEANELFDIRSAARTEHCRATIGAEVSVDLLIDRQRRRQYSVSVFPIVGEKCGIPVQSPTSLCNTLVRQL